jgi:hypothetical protein
VGGWVGRWVGRWDGGWAGRVGGWVARRVKKKMEWGVWGGGAALTTRGALLSCT